MAWQRRDPVTPLTVARRWAITSVRDELDYQALRIQQRTLEQRYHDHLDPLKGDDALYVLNEIDRLAARLGHRPEPWEVVYQARYPSSTLHRFFWPELSEPKSPTAPIKSGAAAAAATRKTPGPETETAEMFSRRFVDAARYAGNTKLDAIGAKMVPPVGGKYLSERIRDLGLDRATLLQTAFPRGLVPGR